MSLPNILLIVTDQQRKDTVGVYGSEICQTPSMDKLASEGIKFERAYTPTGLCSPVRASFFNGVYPHTHKVLTNVALHPVRESLSPGLDYLTPALQKEGYQKGVVGKWHVSHDMTPLDFGFDDYISLGDYLSWRKGQGLPIPDALNDYSVQIAAQDQVDVSQGRVAWLCDQTIELLDKYHQTPESPFFLRLDFHGPHFPNVVPEPYFSMYDPQSIPPWPNADDPLYKKPAVQQMKKRHWRTDQMSWEDWQPLISAYFGEISLIDAQVGRVLQHLEQLKLEQETLVIWTTDHGDTIGAHGICNKDYTMYEEIYRVPFIMKWPGKIHPGTTDHHFTHHFLDIFATLMEIVGGEISEECHGRSLLPLFNHHSTNDWPKEAFCEFHGSHMGLYSMRLLATERYSYIYHTNDIDELYDHQTDPYQLLNVSEDSSYAGTLKDLKYQLVHWMAKTNDHLHNEWTVDWLTNDKELALQAPGRRRTKW